MALTLRQEECSATSTTNLATDTFALTCEPGNAIVCMIFMFSQSETVTGVTLTGGGTENLTLTGGPFDDTGNAYRAYIYHLAEIQNTGSNTISVNLSGYANFQFMAIEVTGQDTVNFKDVEPVSAEGGGNAASVDITTVTDDAFLVGMLTNSSGNGIAGANFIQLTEAGNSNNWEDFEYQQNIGAAGTYAVDWSSPPLPIDWFCLGAAFRPATGAPPPSGSLPVIRQQYERHL